ncbi:MAG: DMT family transporter [Anaerolineae bacterium]|nr:DMT family transporter [Gloeobacterales cyanobacterium ES-bin-313]
MTPPGYVYLWAAAGIFASAASVTRKLTQLGTEHLVNGHNPISLCNLLFVGNLFALVVLVPLYRSQLGSLRSLDRKEWIALIAVAILAGALAPALFFSALSLTMVNNVTLVSRLEPLLTLVLAAWVLRERTGVWEVAGAATACLGVCATVALQGSSIMLGSGSLGVACTALAAVAQAIASTISHRYLGKVPVGAFSVVRTGLGTVIFFCIAIVLYGSHHFAEAFSPFLWEWMLFYGTLIVVIGQTLWVIGGRLSRTADAVLAEAFNPLGAVLAAYLILGEVPTFAQSVGGAIILVGIGLALVGVWKRERDPMLEDRLKLGTDMGFRGI